MLLVLATLVAVAGGPSIAAQDARGVVDRWLAAQNAGDLAAYDKVFASRFTGIRRSGPRTVRFDRAGWMRDRARMFAKPMTVAVSDVKIRAAGKSALVSFVQTFAQGNYKDAGPKELVIVTEAGTLKIASEKMLGSLIESAPVPADERFRFVVSGSLLLSNAPNEEWSTGPTKYTPGIGPTVAFRRVDTAKLPADLARWQGRRIRQINADGSNCDTKVKGFRVLSRSYPPFGDADEMKGASDATVAKWAWDLGAKVLVADVDKPCPEAFWAQPVAADAPAIDAGEKADAALRARAVAQVRKTSAWKEIQKSYLESDSPTAKRWDDPAVETSTEVRRFRARRGGQEIRLVSVTIAKTGACAEFGADLWALYEEQGGKLIPRNTPGKTSATPIATVDSDGDGNSELLYQPGPFSYGTEKGRLLLDGELWDRSEDVSVPYMDCPC